MPVLTILGYIIITIPVLMLVYMIVKNIKVNIISIIATITLLLSGGVLIYKSANDKEIIMIDDIRHITNAKYVQVKGLKLNNASVQIDDELYDVEYNNKSITRIHNNKGVTLYDVNGKDWVNLNKTASENN